MAQKIVGYTALESFWGKLNKWLQYNFESLFSNDTSLENEIILLKKELELVQGRLDELEDTDFTTEDTDDITYEDVFN